MSVETTDALAAQVREALRLFRDIDARSRGDLGCQAQLIILNESLTAGLEVCPCYTGSDGEPGWRSTKKLPSRKIRGRILSCASR